MSAVVVHKFGGTTFTAEGLGHQAAADIICDDLASASGTAPGLKQGVVVSALAETTDNLIKLVRKAVQQNPLYGDAINKLVEQHVGMAAKLLGEGSPELDFFVSRINADADDMRDISHALFLTRHVTPAIRDMLLAYGEIWSSILFCAYLRARGVRAAFLDARDVLCVEPDTASESPTVNWPVTQTCMERFLAQLSPDVDVLVITGYIARTQQGVTTTLLRKGSDFSASIFGNLLSASEIILWTNFDGMYTADPSIVAGAQLIAEMSYGEVLEFSFYGARTVVHPKTMSPAMRAGIPIRIRNTFNRACKGTLIHGTTALHGPLTPEQAVRGLVHRHAVGLITVQGAPITVGDDSPLQERHSLLVKLRAEDISVMMVLHAAAENSLSICVPEEDLARAQPLVAAHFEPEVVRKRVVSITSAGGYALLTAIGEHISHVAGVAAHFFTGLERARVNVHGIAQNGERLVSVLLRDSDLIKGLRAVHAAFRFSPRTIGVGLVCGSGASQHRLARAVLARLARHRAAARPSAHRFEVLGVACASRMRLLTATEGAPPSSPEAVEADDEESVPFDVDQLVEHVRVVSGYRAVIVDCSASKEIAAHYREWLDAGVHVVSGNLFGLSGSSSQFATLYEASRASSSMLLFEEAISSSGFPLVDTIEDMLCAGDRLISLHLNISPIASHLCALLDADVPFCTAVDQLLQRYPTADVKDALSGTELARKTLILAQVVGRPIDADELDIDRLVGPDAWTRSGDEVTVAAAQMRAVADRVEARRREAAADGCVLRYVSILDDDGVRVRLAPFARDNALAKTRGAEISVSIVTSRSVHPFVWKCESAPPLAAGSRRTSAGDDELKADAEPLLGGNILGDLIRLADLVCPE